MALMTFCLSILLSSSPTFSIKFPASDFKWITINDNVMGGISEGDFAIKKSSLIFEGNLSLENNGGFSSIRCLLEGKDLTAFSKVTLKIKGDNRKYGFFIETESYMVSPNYRAEFVAKDKWQDLTLDLETFEQTYFGRSMGNKLKTSKLNSVERLGLIIADKKQGPFKLEIKEITFE